MQGACSDKVKQGSDGIGDTTAVHTVGLEGLLHRISGNVSGGSPRTEMVRLERPPLNSSSSPTTPRPKDIPTAPSLGRRASRNGKDDNGVSGRVRVAVRVRPRNSEELKNDADFTDYVELMPELKRLKLRKNNWDCETFQFDETLNETASQKRVYEVVAKPVVESVLEGYNGTIMAYGQTGTGKTFTLGKLGEEDAANRGIMVRAMEDILADTSFEQGSVTVSYLQGLSEYVVMHDTKRRKGQSMQMG